MATFAVIPIDDAVQSVLKEKLPELFGDRAYPLPGQSGGWLVSYEGTSRQLFDKTGIEGSVIVLNFAGYWGVAPQDVWEWINLSQGQK